MCLLSRFALCVSFAFLTGGNALGANCPFGPEATPKLLESLARSSNCAKAVQTARICFEGNSADLGIEKAAGAACERSFRKTLTESDKKLLETLKTRCDKKFASEQGTLALSAQASCRLDVYKVFHHLAAPFEN